MSEWAQLLAGPPANPRLERGRWYRVESRTHEGIVRLLSADAVGVTTHTNFVRIIDHAPDTVTRVQDMDFQAMKGQMLPTFPFRGVCPAGHRIEKLGAVDEARCPQCSRTCRVEDEGKK